MGTVCRCSCQSDSVDSSGTPVSESSSTGKSAVEICCSMASATGTSSGNPPSLSDMHAGLPEALRPKLRVEDVTCNPRRGRYSWSS